MSWESVREPANMHRALLLVQNITRQTEAPQEILEWTDEVRGCFDEVMDALNEGEAR